MCEEKIIDAIIADARMDIPEEMLATKQEQMAEAFGEKIQEQGISVEQYFQYTGLTREALLEQFRPHAERQIKSRLALEAVAEAEKIEVSEAECQTEIRKRNDFNNGVAEWMSETADIKEMIEDIKVQKALDFVVKHAVK